jgi:hypothetical protein
MNEQERDTVWRILDYLDAFDVLEVVVEVVASLFD